MKTPYIVAIAAIFAYLLFKNQSSSGNPVACTSCGGSVGVTAVPVTVPTTTQDTTQTSIVAMVPEQGTIALPNPSVQQQIQATYPTSPVTTPASVAQPILTYQNSPDITNFYIRGTPSANSL